MTASIAFVPARFAVAFVLDLGLVIFGLDRMARYSTWEAQVWAEFWLALTSVIPIVVLWPVVRYGSLWLRLGASLLYVLPLLVLSWVLPSHFGLMPRWLR